MIRNNQKHLNKLHVVMDAVIIILAYVCAWGIKFGNSIYTENIGRLGLTIYLEALVIIVPGYLILYAMASLYAPKRMHGQRYELKDLIKANTAGLMIFIVVLYIFHLVDFSRAMIFIFYALNILYGMAGRIVVRMVLRKIRKSGFNQKHIVLVGYSRAAVGYIDRIMDFPQWGYHIVGILDDNVAIGTKYRGHKVMGRVSDIEDVIERNDLDEMVITLGIKEYGKLEDIVNTCEKSGLHTKFIPDYNNIFPTRPHIEDVHGLPVINIRNVPLSVNYNKFIKRAMDIGGAIFGLILFSPVILFTALLVKLTSKGPVIYKQKRVGLHNKEFEMYKFRSMRTENDGSDMKGWTTSADPRVTGIGKIIRKTSIDELPQFVNVLKGDMSLVGPRPERLYYVNIFKEDIPRYMVKHQIRPGITGWAQVNGLRGDTCIETRIEFDLYYIENWSVIFDIKILFRTIFKGFVNKNAY